MTGFGLQHIHKKTPNGVDVFILDKGELINSEAEAMLQALHSRSTGGLKTHLKILAEKGADNFMAKFYVGYGHKSIGDCGSVTLFIEGISMLGAKAIQDSKLYNGQEASTRYVDFSKQAIINPLGSDTGKQLLEKQRIFYLSLFEPIKHHIRQLHPPAADQDEKIYDKTISAKVFDIARGFLPAGCSTNLAWHTTLRQVADRMLWLRHHSLEEVREVAVAIEQAVLEKYPNSFSTKKYEETEHFLSLTSGEYYFFKQLSEDFHVTCDHIDSQELQRLKWLFDARPNNKTELPTYLDLLGTITYDYLLDFGSFRDIQRHRAPYQRMPLLTTKLGFNQRYLASLPEETRERAIQHLKQIGETLENLDATPEIQQYYTPMGFNLSCQMMGTLPALIYLAELRSTTYVHATHRQVAIKKGEYITKKHGLKIFLDKQKDLLDLRRGKHDIEIK